MQDYTYRSNPVSQMSLEDIQSCLKDGIEITDSAGLSDHTACERVRKRLELELLIRRLHLRDGL